MALLKVCSTTAMLPSLLAFHINQEHLKQLIDVLYTGYPQSH
jgi:hypothetical protein